MSQVSRDYYVGQELFFRKLSVLSRGVLRAQQKEISLNSP